MKEEERLGCAVVCVSVVSFYTEAVVMCGAVAVSLLTKMMVNVVRVRKIGGKRTDDVYGVRTDQWLLKLQY